MRFRQKFLLGILLIFNLLLLALTAYLYYQNLQKQPVSTRKLEVRSFNPTRQDSTAPIIQIENDQNPSSTPFKPQPITPSPTPLPTHTPSPTITPSPTETPAPTATITPSSTPTPDQVSQAYIEGIWGFPQAYNLSCESRSASDLARYFGVHFTELEFLYALPSSDNPDKGFVGNVHGYLGQLPPNGYGVHAEPVAQLMRAFGLDANAHVGFDFDTLLAEISAGRPVMVWAIAELGYSTPVEYTTSDGSIAIVARFEHTFIVIGFNESSITVLDNERVYSVSHAQFLRSWGALQNMAVTVQGN